MAKVIMVQGTMSNVGKSIVCAGLCRVFMQDGLRAVPFKSQNMALNSYITDEGLEMGRAQVMQAEAAGVVPSVLMNPILLKPTSDMGSQVIVNGTPIGTMKASEYFKYKHNLIPDIMESFNRLAENADVIVIEGAGSPAEINLKSEDIVNMGMAEMVDAPVLLVGDIDRGGVFAQLVGTLELLTEDEKKRIKGLIINKFRGDVSILKPGIDMLEGKVGIPVIGTLPYTYLTIDDEDSLSERLDKNDRGIIDIVVIRLPRMSNFSDFMCFEQIPEVSVRYASSPKELVGADMVILPGTKNTIADLRWLRESGIEAAVIKYSREGIVFGICGGYQMLGMTVSDPYQVEEGGSIRGMELLPLNTVLTKDKTRTQVNGRIQSIGGPLSLLSGLNICGYEIHMGESRIDGSGNIIAEILSHSSQIQNPGADVCDKYDGLWNGNVYGSYVHGFFDNEDITAGIVRCLADRKGIDISVSIDSSFEEFKQKQYDILADMIRNNMDMDMVYKVLGDYK